MASDQTQQSTQDQNHDKEPGETQRKQSLPQDPVQEERRSQPGSESGEEPLTQSGNQQIALEE